MKKIFQILYTSALVALVCSCGNSGNFTIDGIVDDPELNGKTVYMLDMSGSTAATCTNDGPVDSAMIVDGKFFFKGTVDDAWIAILNRHSS